MSKDLDTMTRAEMFERLQVAGWMDTEEDRALAEREWAAIERRRSDPQPYMDYIRFLGINYLTGSSRYRPTPKPVLKKKRA